MLGRARRHSVGDKAACGSVMKPDDGDSRVRSPLGSSHMQPRVQAVHTRCTRMHEQSSWWRSMRAELMADSQTTCRRSSRRLASAELFSVGTHSSRRTETRDHSCMHQDGLGWLTTKEVKREREHAVRHAQPAESVAPFRLLGTLTPRSMTSLIKRWGTGRQGEHVPAPRSACSGCSSPPAAVLVLDYAASHKHRCAETAGLGNCASRDQCRSRAQTGSLLDSALRTVTLGAQAAAATNMAVRADPGQG